MEAFLIEELDRAENEAYSEGLNLGRKMGAEEERARVISLAKEYSQTWPDFPFKISFLEDLITKIREQNP